MSAKVFVGDPPPFDQNVFELCPGRALLLHTVAVGTCKVLYDVTIKVFVFLDVNRGRVGFPRLEPGLNRLCPPFAVVPLAKKTDGVLQPCCCTAAVRLTTQPSFHDHWGGGNFRPVFSWGNVATPGSRKQMQSKKPSPPPSLATPPPPLASNLRVALGGTVPFGGRRLRGGCPTWHRRRRRGCGPASGAPCCRRCPTRTCCCSTPNGQPVWHSIGNAAAGCPMQNIVRLWLLPPLTYMSIPSPTAPHTWTPPVSCINVPFWLAAEIIKLKFRCFFFYEVPMQGDAGSRGGMTHCWLLA